MSGRRVWILLLSLLLLVCGVRVGDAQQTAGAWRAATDKELQSLLPARATVVKEHIETEMRTASGITDGHGKYVAGIVLITAGYSADGKYSHYVVTQVPLQMGALLLPPGEYVFGWQREGDVLNVHFYDAATGVENGTAQAKRMQGVAGVVSFKIWPPGAKSMMQIGRFGIAYQVGR